MSEKVRTFEEILNETNPLIKVGNFDWADTNYYSQEQVKELMKVAHDQAVDLCVEKAKAKLDMRYVNPFLPARNTAIVDKESILKVKDLLK